MRLKLQLQGVLFQVTAMVNWGMLVETPEMAKC